MHAASFNERRHVGSRAPNLRRTRGDEDTEETTEDTEERRHSGNQRRSATGAVAEPFVIGRSPCSHRDARQRPRLSAQRPPCARWQLSRRLPRVSLFRMTQVLPFPLCPLFASVSSASVTVPVSLS